MGLGPCVEKPYGADLGNLDAEAFHADSLTFGNPQDSYAGLLCMSSLHEEASKKPIELGLICTRTTCSPKSPHVGSLIMSSPSTTLPLGSRV